MKFDENLDMADIVQLAFHKDLDRWVDTSLPIYLDYRYVRWVMSPKVEGMVEVFIDDTELPSEEEYAVEEDCYDIALYMGLAFLESLGIEDNGYMVEIMADYVSERILVYPLSDIVEDYKEDDGLFISEKLMKE